MVMDVRSVRHVSTIHLSNTTFSLNLHNFLHVPTIQKNLFFVQKYAEDTNTYFDFNYSHFVVTK